MELSQIKAHKATLEQHLAKVFQQFMEITGVPVSSVDLQYILGYNGDSYGKTLSPKVKIELNYEADASAFEKKTV